jgi:hypothetical protein
MNGPSAAVTSFNDPENFRTVLKSDDVAAGEADADADDDSDESEKSATEATKSAIRWKSNETLFSSPARWQIKLGRFFALLVFFRQI